MVIPETIQKLISERETLRAEMTEKEKDLAAMARKERALSAKVEAAWQGQLQKVADVLK